MKLNLYQIDAFTDKPFGGNSACVVPLDNWLEDDISLKIAKENAVAETAFFVEKGNKIHLRWFTPEIEMDLCGHATLATAHCLKTILDYKSDKFVFETLSGYLTVEVENNIYKMNFSSRNTILRLGAKQDRVLRNHQIISDGSFRDTVVFSIIESEWKTCKRALKYKIEQIHEKTCR